MVDREKRRVYYRRWRALNKERIAEYNRRRRACRRRYKAKLRAQNPQLAGQQLRQYFAKNPGKRSAYRAAHYARKKKQTPLLSKIERAAVYALYTHARALTKLTGEAYHVDHIIPLAKGGLHHPSNLQVLRGVDNQRKGAR